MLWKLGAAQLIPCVREVTEGRMETEQEGRPARVTPVAREYVP